MKNKGKFWGSRWQVAVCVLLTAYSCGSRKVERYTQSAESIKQNAKSQELETKSEKTITIHDTIFIEKKLEVKAETNEQRQKQSTEKHREYYENGTLKSETEKNMLETEIVHQLKHENATLKEENKRLGSLSEALEFKIREQSKEVQKLNSEIKHKQTNRRAYPWYWFVFGGIVVWEFGKLLWRIYKPIKLKLK